MIKHYGFIEEDHKMKAFVCRASDGFFTSERGAEREFDSLENALTILTAETHTCEYVVSMGGPWGSSDDVDWTIEIYDDYRE